MTVTGADSTFGYRGSGDLEIVAYRWDPASPPSAAVQLAHGMGEHALRYDGLARELAAAGMVVYAQDHRGHGASAPSAESLGQLGADGWSRLVDDMHVLTGLIRAEHPGLPVVLLAHSMGSFAAQQYLLDYSSSVDAVVLTGTTALDQLEPAFDLDQPLDLSALNAAFVPARTDFDWLSRDEAVVDAYVGDPLCGFGLDVESGKQMFLAARRMADPDAVARIRDDLPVYLAAGEQDPINGNVALVELVAGRLRAAGLTDVTVRAYPGARHEILNETNRDEVVADILAWLRRALP
jgi:alpha-beta hydrolase superfamily lysophospholipase